MDQTPSDGLESDWEKLLGLYLEGRISSAQLAARDALSERSKTFIGLAAHVALNQMDEFERQVHSALVSGVSAHELMCALLELADHGVRVPQRAFDLVRSSSA